MELVKQKSVQINVIMTQEAIQERNELEQELVQKYNLLNFQEIPTLLTKDQYDQWISNIQQIEIEVYTISQMGLFPVHTFEFKNDNSEDLFKRCFSDLSKICNELTKKDNLDKNKFEGFFTIVSMFKYVDPYLCTNGQGIMYDFMQKYKNEISHILAVIFGDMEPAFLNGGIFDVPN